MSIVKLAKRDSSDEHLHHELSGLCLLQLVWFAMRAESNMDSTALWASCPCPSEASGSVWVCNCERESEYGGGMENSFNSAPELDQHSSFNQMGPKCSQQLQGVMTDTCTEFGALQQGSVLEVFITDTMFARQCWYPVQWCPGPMQVK